MKKYLEYKDHVSNKFWEINLKGPQINLTYGRIGISNPAKIKKNLKEKMLVMMKKNLLKKR
tara:strand:- start:37 stop:219 length:183 start_codon:yes stop_codon:yes gene_type:complete